MSTEPEIWSKVATVAPDVEGLTGENFKKILQRGKLPPKWNYPILSAAKRKKIKLTHDDLVSIN